MGDDNKTDKSGATDQVAGEKHQTKIDAPNPTRLKKSDSQSSGEETQDHSEQENTQDAPKDEGKNNESGDTKLDTKTGEDAEEPGKEPDTPSSILEKGIIYFFIRGRVGIDEPKTLDDIARSYILLRPIAHDAKLGEGTLQDAGTTRLLALPKKALPKSGKDRFMTFVEKAGASYDEIKSQFLASSDYETKTAGTRHSPAAAPVGEGVYAISSTGRDSHLAYMKTLPEKSGEVQESLGIKEQGSFIISSKNPQYSGPANAQLPKGPDFPKRILDEFRSLRWSPSKPEHFDYPNAQFLLVGESSGVEKALEKQDDDEKKDNEDPSEAMEHLEEEDLNRMKHLPGDESASIYADLEAHAKDYPKLQTTF